MLQRFTIAAKIIYGVVLVAILMGLNGCRSIQKTGGMKISLVVNYPVVIINDGIHDGVNFFNLRDTVYIFYYNNYMVYHLSGNRDLKTDEKIPGSDSWFLLHKHSISGYLFNSISDSSKGLRLPADSFLTKRAYANASFNITEKDSLVESFENKDTLIEKYFINKSNDELHPDSLYFYFCKKYKDIDYTFSPKLDSVKNMKLYKVRLLYNAKFSTTYKTALPKREYLFEIRNEGKNNAKQLDDFISRVSKSYAFQ
jgi:hypothetical protein